MKPYPLDVTSDVPDQVRGGAKPESHPTKFPHNPAPAIGTCERCGSQLVYASRRHGGNAGIVHKETGRAFCG